MPESTERDGAGNLPPEDVFSLLGNEIRIEIIQALWRAGNDRVSFSELRDRTGVADSGQFNYHLDRLAETFVHRDEDGYELTYAGQRIIGAILDGTYTKRVDIDPFEIEASCSACGSSLEASYANDRFVVRCSACEETVLQFAFPPGVFEDRPRRELSETAGRWIRAQLSFTVGGICPNCSGVITHSITTELDETTTGSGSNTTAIDATTTPRPRWHYISATTPQSSRFTTTTVSISPRSSGGATSGVVANTRSFDRKIRGESPSRSRSRARNSNWWSTET